MSYVELKGKNISCLRDCLIKACHVMYQKMHSVTGDFLKDSPCVLSGEAGYEWDNRVKHTILSELYGLMHYGTISLFNCEAMDLDYLNRSGFFLYDAELLFYAAVLLCHQEYFEEVRDRKKTGRADRAFQCIFHAYEGCEEYLLEQEAWLPYEVMSVFDEIVYGKDVSKGVKVWLSSMRKNLGLSEIPDRFFRYIFPDLLSALMGYDNAELFVFYHPLAGEFDRLLSFAAQTDLTEQMVRARNVLQNCIPEQEGICRMVSDEGLLIWGSSDILCHGDSGFHTLFPWALLFFEAHFGEWKKEVEASQKAGEQL